MLQANNQYGRLTTPALMTAKQMHSLRRESFFCPVCQGPVIMRAGQQIMPHFAHKAHANCLNRDQGEGIYHEQGKLLLFNWLSKQFPQNTSLEMWLSDIQQRPDIYLRLAHRQIAVEYQCAHIPIKHIHNRNRGYQQHQTTPLWILGAHHFKRLSQNEFRMSPFLRQFIHDFAGNHPSTLFFFDPHQSELVIIQDIYEITPVRSMGQLQFYPLESMRFTDLFKVSSFTTFDLLTLWKKAKRRFRLAVDNRLYGHHLHWHQWLYERQSHRQHLPACVYLPVRYQHLMKTPVWDWQSRLCIDLFLPMPIGGIITLQSCLHFLRKYLSLALSDNKTAIPHQHHPIRQYLQWLIHIGIMSETAPNLFKKQQHIQQLSHIEQSLQADEDLMNELSAKINTTRA